MCAYGANIQTDKFKLRQEPICQSQNYTLYSSIILYAQQMEIATLYMLINTTYIHTYIHVHVHHVHNYVQTHTIIQMTLFVIGR